MPLTLHASTATPSDVSRWSRPFPLSETITLPSGATATSFGELNWPSPEPADPNAVMAPDTLTRHTRSIAPSAIQRVPSGPTPMPRYCELLNGPYVATKLPAGSSFCTRLFSTSAT